MRIITVSENGDRTIPTHFTDLGFKPGDRFDVQVESTGIRLRRLSLNPLPDLEGAFAGGDSLIEALLDARRRDREQERHR
jgi:hypothetical protein